MQNNLLRLLTDYIQLLSKSGTLTLLTSECDSTLCRDDAEKKWPSYSTHTLLMRERVFFTMGTTIFRLCNINDA